MLAIMCGQDLRGKFDIIGNMKQKGQTGFGKWLDEACDICQAPNVMISSLFERAEGPFNSTGCFIAEYAKLF
jgi:hypothetical protein